MITTIHPRQEHSSPHRARAPLPALIFALGGGMAAWTLSLLTTYAVGNYHCFSLFEALPRRPLDGLEPWLFVGYVAALAVTAAAFLVGWRVWRATRDEKPGGASHAADMGTGRSRFLAIWAMAFNGIIGLTILTHALALLLSPACAVA